MVAVIIRTGCEISFLELMVLSQASGFWIASWVRG